MNSKIYENELTQVYNNKLSGVYLEDAVQQILSFDEATFQLTDDQLEMWRQLPALNSLNWEVLDRGVDYKGQIYNVIVINFMQSSDGCYFTE